MCKTPCTIYLRCHCNSPKTILSNYRINAYLAVFKGISSTFFVLFVVWKKSRKNGWGNALSGALYERSFALIPLFTSTTSLQSLFSFFFFMPAPLRALHSNAILISTKSIEIYWIFFVFKPIDRHQFLPTFFSYTFDSAHSGLFVTEWVWVEVVVLFFTLTFSECERKQPKNIFIVSMQCVVFDVPADRSLYLYRMFCLISCRSFFPMLWRFVVMYQSICLSFGFTIRKY